MRRNVCFLTVTKEPSNSAPQGHTNSQRLLRRAMKRREHVVDLVALDRRERDLLETEVFGESEELVAVGGVLRRIVS